MEKFTSSADKALAKKVFHAFTHQLLAQGSITEEDLKNTSHLFLKIKKILSKSTINMVIDYRENILKEAEALQKKKQYDFSIIYYAMFFEHSINGIITHQTEKLNLSTKSKMGIIKSTNIESKFTWILEILELPTFNSTHLKTIIKTSEIRKALLHKSQVGRVSPFPKRIYATATVHGRPSMLKRFKMAARTCSSAT